MATWSELGQKVKAKYPGQYDSLSDYDVGKKVVAKYPKDYGQFQDDNLIAVEEARNTPATVPNTVEKQGGGFREFARNLPTTLARTVAQPVEFVERLGATIGQGAAKALHVNIPVSKKTRAKVQNFNKGFSTPTVLPTQTTPLIGENRSFNSAREAVGSGLEAGLNVGTAFVGGAGTSQVFKQGLRASLPMLAKGAVLDAGAGAAFGAAQGLQNKDETKQQIGKDALIGGVAGALLPPVLGGLGKILVKGGGFLKKGTNAILEDVATRLENKVPQAGKIAGKRFYEGVDTQVSPTTQKVAQKVASGIRTLQAAPGRLKTALYDKFEPIRRFTEKAREAGIDAPDLQDVVQSAHYKGTGIAENKLDDYLALRKKYEPVWGAVKEYSHYLDDIDRLNLGQSISGGRTLQDIQRDIAGLRSSVGEATFTQLGTAQKELQQFLGRELDDAVASGRISQQSLAAIQQSHPNYIPHDVLDYLDEEGIQQGLGHSFNMAKSGIEKAKGSERAIDDIDNAVVRRLLRQNLLNEKNKAVKAIISVGEKMGEGGGFTPLRTAEVVKERSALLNDMREKMALREDTSNALKKVRRISTALATKLGKTRRELDSLLSEAQIMASEFAAPSKIDVLFRKIEGRDFKIERLLKKLSSGQNAIAEKELGRILEDTKGDISDLRQAIAGVRDTKMNSVDIPKGYEKVSFFQDGIREDWIIPADIGGALKNLNPDEASAVMSWLNNSLPGKLLTLPARTLRRLATGANPMFALFSNPLRDIQTTQITAKAHPQDFAKGLIAVLTKGKQDNELYHLARASGALQGSIYQDERNAAKLLQTKLSKNGVFNRITSPLKLVEDAGQTMEEMTRIAVFKRAMKDGKTPSEAAKVARDATVDFGRSGNVTQVINKVVPFLNARIQGFGNLLSAAKNDPTKFIRVGLWTAAYPAALLTAHNTRFDSYYSIPDYERRKYWIVMLGQTEGEDYDGNKINIPHYVKIPKGEAQQAISNVVERVLLKGRELYPDTSAEFIKKLIGDTSPVPAYEGSGIVGSLLPTGVQQAVELSSNYSFYRGGQIEPDYIYKDNPNVGKTYADLGASMKTKYPGSYDDLTDEELGKKIATSKKYKDTEYATYGPSEKSFAAKDLEPKERSMSSTTAVAKAIGSVLNWSPIKIDYVIKTGVLNDILRIENIFKPEDTKVDKATALPFARSLLGNSTYQLQLDRQKQKASDDKAATAEKLQKFLSVPQ